MDEYGTKILLVSKQRVVAGAAQMAEDVVGVVTLSDVAKNVADKSTLMSRDRTLSVQVHAAARPPLAPCPLSLSPPTLTHTSPFPSAQPASSPRGMPDMTRFSSTADNLDRLDRLTGVRFSTETGGA